MTFKRFMRLSIFILMIAIASIIPVPMTFKGKDNLPQNLTEQVEENDKEEEASDIKEIT